MAEDQKHRILCEIGVRLLNGRCTLGGLSFEVLAPTLHVGGNLDRQGSTCKE